MDYPGIVNQALQAIGTRTTVTAMELASNTSNEAIQANLVIDQIRDNLVRMAPWDCSTGAVDLQYITSLPGTPENQTQAPLRWVPGLPLPSFSYEYAYPADCLRALWIVPQSQTGIEGTPITTAVTGLAPIWRGPPIVFKVRNDQFYSALSATVASGGTGYAAGDTIQLARGPNTSPPIGGPAMLQVTEESAGVITAVEVVNTWLNASPAQSGTYFKPQLTPQAQFSTSGAGLGATFNLTFTSAPAQQRVIVTNQCDAVLMYCRQIIDPNTMDNLFQTAWINILAASLCMALTGDKSLANMKIQLANAAIQEARAVDGNEGLTINDVTPDFIRVRGVIYSDYWFGPNDVNWGPLWGSFN